MSQQLRDEINRHKRRTQVLEALATIVDDDPEFVETLLDLLGANGHAKRPQSPAKSNEIASSDSIFPEAPSRPARASHEVIREFFSKNNNEWATVADVAMATGWKKNTIAHQIYHSRKEMFEARENPMKGLARQFRLRNPGSA